MQRFFGNGDKKFIILCILDILQNKTDFKHPMLQTDILDELKNYGFDCDRKTVGANLQVLEDFGYKICHCGKKGVYLAGDFSNGELRMLIDSVLFSTNISKEKAQDLIGKIVGKSNGEFANSIHAEYYLKNVYHTKNEDTFENINLIHKAIEGHRQIAFFNLQYGTDKKLHIVDDKKNVVNPLQFVFSMGNYFLICNEVGTEKLKHIKIDKMQDIEILDEVVEQKIAKLIDGTELGKYVSKHPYMCEGEPERIKLMVKSTCLDSLIDTFGDDVEIERTLGERENAVSTVFFRSTLDDVASWYFVHYEDVVKILEPQELREKVVNITSSLSQQNALSEEDLFSQEIARAKECSTYRGLPNVRFRNINLTLEKRQMKLKEITSTPISYWSFDNNQLESLDFLRESKSTRRLYVRNNPITDVEFLKEFDNLICLQLEKTNITSLDFLKGNASVEWLFLEQNPIQNYDFLYSMKALSRLDVDGEVLKKIDTSRLVNVDIRSNEIQRCAEYKNVYQNELGIIDDANVMNYDFPQNLLVDMFGKYDIPKEFERACKIVNPSKVEEVLKVFECYVRLLNTTNNNGVMRSFLCDRYVCKKSLLQIANECGCSVAKIVLLESRIFNSFRRGGMLNDIQQQIGKIVDADKVLDYLKRKDKMPQMECLAKKKEFDEILDKFLKCARIFSTSAVQIHFDIGYHYAIKIMDELKAEGKIEYNSETRKYTIKQQVINQN